VYSIYIFKNFPIIYILNENDIDSLKFIACYPIFI